MLICLPTRFVLALQNVNQKSCAHEYNYVVTSLQADRKPNHKIIFMCTAFWFTAVIDFVVGLDFARSTQTAVVYFPVLPDYDCPS